MAILQVSQFLVVSLVGLACEELYLFSSAVYLFPVILQGEEAVTLLSDGRSGLYSGSLVTGSNSNMEFQSMHLQDHVRKRYCE